MTTQHSSNFKLVFNGSVNDPMSQNVQEIESFCIHGTYSDRPSEIHVKFRLDVSGLVERNLLELSTKKSFTFDHHQYKPNGDLIRTSTFTVKVKWIELSGNHVTINDPSSALVSFEYDKPPKVVFQTH